MDCLNSFLVITLLLTIFIMDIDISAVLIYIKLILKNRRVAMMSPNFWTGEGGVEGDFSYGLIHILSIVFVVASCIILTVMGTKMNKENKRKTIILLATFGIGFEVFWRIVYLINGSPLIDLYPFYPCNLAGILIPLIALSNKRMLKEVFYLFALIGGIVTYVMPEGVFVYQVLTFGILKSILQHWAIIVIPVFEFVNKIFRPKFKYFYLTIIGMLVHLINSEFVPKMFGIFKTDYIFLYSGLPFVIPGVPGWLTLSVFGMLVVVLVYALLDIKGCKKLLARKGEK